MQSSSSWLSFIQKLKEINLKIWDFFCVLNFFPVSVLTFTYVPEFSFFVEQNKLLNLAGRRLAKYGLLN